MIVCTLFPSNSAVELEKEAAGFSPMFLVKGIELAYVITGYLSGWFFECCCSPFLTVSLRMFSAAITKYLNLGNLLRKVFYLPQSFGGQKSEKYGASCREEHLAAP